MQVEIKTEPTTPEPGCRADASVALDRAMQRKDDCESFVLLATHFSDMFFSAAIGYWSTGVKHMPGRGWLVYEHGGDTVPSVEECALAVVAWRKGDELPKRWFRLDRQVATNAFAEGVKRWGLNWYSDRSDAGTYDVVIQQAMLGEVRYG